MGALLRILVVLLVVGGCQPARDDGRGTGLVGQTRSEFEALSRKRRQTQRTAKAQKETLPSRNRAKGDGPPIPDVDTDEPARRLVDFLAGREDSGAEEMFIPFRRYALLHPRYSRGALAAIYERKSRRYLSRIRALRRQGRFRGAIYLSFVLGRCRFLKEGDAGRYECSARIEMEKEGIRLSLPVRRVLNWGNRWYILEM